MLGSVARNVLASWGVYATNLIIGFFLTRYMLDLLGVSTYGSWLLINSIAAYSGLLYCGMGETISRFVAKFHSENDPQRINQVVTLILTIYVITGGIAILLAGVLCLTAGWWGSWTGGELLQARLTIMILGVNVAIGIIGSVFGGVLLGLRRFDLERSTGFVFEVTRLVLFLTFLNETYGLVTIALIHFVVIVCQNLMYIIMAYRLLPTLSVGPLHIDRKMFRECWQFSSMSLVNVLANQVINATDTITIGLLLGKEAIVPYYFGLRLVQFAKQPIDKIAAICMPTVGALTKETDRNKRNRFLVKTLGIVFLLMGAAFIGAWFFALDVIRLWVGSKLDSDQLAVSHRVLTILLGAQLIVLPCNILRAFLFGSGHVKVPALIYVAEAASNLTLSIVLCLMYGVEGVAWGTTIPVVIFEMGILFPYAMGKLEVSLWRISKEAVMPQLLPLCVLLAYSVTVANYAWCHYDWRGMITVATAGAAILGAGIWLQRRLYGGSVEAA